MCDKDKVNLLAVCTINDVPPVIAIMGQQYHSNGGGQYRVVSIFACQSFDTALKFLAAPMLVLVFDLVFRC